MVTALPRNIQLKLDQTLAQWHQWRCTPPLSSPPQIIEPLTSGLSNFSFLVETDRQFVVRIDGLNPAANGLSRQAEWRALQAAHRAGLAPHPRYFNPDLGSLVCDFLIADENAIDEIGNTASLLRKIHELPALHTRLDLYERIIRYEKHVQHKGTAVHPTLTECRSKVLNALDAIKARKQRFVLCHNDLLRANRIVSGSQVWAIDWEYCAMGNAWFDLAVVAVGDSLDRSQTQQLLNCYLGRAATEQEQFELQQHCCVYRYLELLWYSTLPPPQGGGQHNRLSIADKLRQLAQTVLP
jgi:thiamine kinase